MGSRRGRVGFAVKAVVAAVVVAGSAAGCGAASLSGSAADLEGSAGQNLSPASVQNISGTQCVTGEVRAFASPQLPSGYMPATGGSVPKNIYGALAQAYNATGADVPVPDMSKAVLAVPKDSAPILWGVCVGADGSTQWNTNNPQTACASSSAYWLMPKIAGVKMPTIAGVGAVMNLPESLAWYECGDLEGSVGPPYVGSLVPFAPGNIPSQYWVAANGGPLTPQLEPLNYMLAGQTQLPNLTSLSGTGPQFAIAFRGNWPPYN